MTLYFVIFLLQPLQLILLPSRPELDANLDFAPNRTILVFSGVFTYLVAAYPLYAASALAANSFARSSFAAAFPLFGIQSEFQSFSTVFTTDFPKRNGAIGTTLV